MIETINHSERFYDHGELIYEIGDEFLVVCPNCSGKAKVFPGDTNSEKLSERLTAPRKVVCQSCFYRGNWIRGRMSIGGAHDWYFQLPLWLQISCCGETLWAYNERHLKFIENYVSAKLRERKPFVNKSLASRLPQWIKSAKNRDEILKAIARLRVEKL